MSGCSECGRTPLEARGMCATHYKRAWRGPSTLWHRGELLAEVDALAGETPERIAERLGVSLSAIEKAARRSGRVGIARIFGRAYRNAKRAGRSVGQSVGVVRNDGEKRFPGAVTWSVRLNGESDRLKGAAMDKATAPEAA